MRSFERLLSAKPHVETRPLEWVVPIVVAAVMLVVALLSLPKGSPPLLPCTVLSHGSYDVRVVVFGASGGTGRELVAQALSEGRQVTAFVRNPARLSVRSPELHVAQGDVTDMAAVERAIQCQDAVLCALGAASPLRRDSPLIDGVQNIVDAMRRYGTRRLVYLSFLGVRQGRRQLSVIGRTLVAPLLLRNVVADHEAKERIIQQSGLEWVIVRPPRLTNRPGIGRYRHGVDIRAASVIPTISRADVADFMLRQLADNTYVHRTPAVMY